MGSDDYDDRVARLKRDYRRGEWIVKGSYIFLVPLIMTLWAGSWVLATILIFLMAGTWWIGDRKRKEARDRLKKLWESHI